ncbi:MAG: hypothetical protein LBL00_04775 [Endomicrobium sp.]|nr:hypothetical protein [Endomicrobium sp.]
MKKFLDEILSKIKDFFMKLGSNNAGESIIIDEEQFKFHSSDKIMNENIRRYNKLLEEIEKIRIEIRFQIPNFEKSSKEFITFVNTPREEISDNDDDQDAKPKNPYINDFMLRRNEFEEKTRKLSEVFNKIAELRKNEINKYFEAKRLINNNSIIIGEKKVHEIEVEKEK